MEESCFKKHGIPEWFKERRDKQSSINAVSSSTVDDNSSATNSFSEMFQKELQKYLTLPTVKEEANPVSAAYFADFAGNFASLRSHHTSSWWIIDSGASNHVCGLSSFLTNMKQPPDKNTVQLPDGSIKSVTLIGDVIVNSSLVLKNVLYVLDFKFNLLSVARLVSDSQIRVLFHEDICTIQDLSSDKVLATGHMEHHLYFLDGVSSATSPAQDISCNVFTKESLLSPKDSLWHDRLGHPSSMVLGHLPFPASSNKPCDVCHAAEQTKLSFPTSTSTTSCIFELLHVDIWGPYKELSLSGARYMLTLVDDFSRATWTFLMRAKSQTVTLLETFFKYVNTHFKTVVKTVRSDNGLEFLSIKCQELFAKNGVVHQKSCVYTPQQNGLVERKHRHLAQVARALLFNSGCSTRFWGEAMLSASFLINKLPTHSLQWKSPFEVLTSSSPNYSYLKVFGCLCYVSNTNPHKSKFDPRASKGIFEGYPPGQKAYKVFLLDSQEVVISRDVLFYEDSFPFKNHISLVPIHSMPIFPTSQTFHSDDIDLPSSSSAQISSSSSVPLSSLDSTIPSDNSSSVPLRRSTRPKTPPVWHKDYVACSVPYSSSYTPCLSLSSSILFFCFLSSVYGEYFFF